MNDEEIDYEDIEEDYIIDFNKPTYEELQQRIDKAIEYIKHYGNLYCMKNIQFKKYYQYKELLEILGDKENEEK